MRRIYSRLIRCCQCSNALISLIRRIRDLSAVLDQRADDEGEIETFGGIARGAGGGAAGGAAGGAGGAGGIEERAKAGGQAVDGVWGSGGLGPPPPHRERRETENPFADNLWLRGSSLGAGRGETE